MNRTSRFRFLLCDLDDTLYPVDAGVMKAVGDRISRFMSERLDISPEIAPRLRSYFHEQYGTSLRGLMLHYGINPESYLEFVHDLPLADHIRPDPALDAMLASLCLTRVIITNASREHALRVLDLLGVRQRFDRIVDVRDFGFHSKPHRAAYEQSLLLLGARPQECIMVEDSARNLAPARAMGMLGVLVRSGSSDAQPAPDAADIVIDTISELGEAIRPLIGC
jgi:putative hydrolase of the HAD superfamily